MITRRGGYLFPREGTLLEASGVASRSFDRARVDG